MNSFRIETLNITGNGKIESFLVQGGLRWQSITLISGKSVTISKVGLKPAYHIEGSEPSTRHIPHLEKYL